MKLEERRHKYSCSVDLMEAVRRLYYLGRYKVCEEFYRMSFVGLPGDDMPFCRLFNNLFERINKLFGGRRESHQAVCEQNG